MARVPYATVLYMEGIFIWEMSWLQTCFSFKRHFLSLFTCMSIEVSEDTCFQEAWTKWKDKDFMNFISYRVQLVSPVFDMVDYVNIIVLHVGCGAFFRVVINVGAQKNNI